MISTKERLIINGYETFAYKGLDGIKIEQISKQSHISKSSFYHHFADLDNFMFEILNLHILRSNIVSKKERDAKNLIELSAILAEHKVDLLFNRQLRIHQNISMYSEILNKSNQIIGSELISFLSKEFCPNVALDKFNHIYNIALDNFYLQINSENLNQEWLLQYFNNLKNSINKIC